MLAEKHEQDCNAWQEEAEGDGATPEDKMEDGEDVFSEDEEGEHEQSDDEDRHQRMLADVSTAVAGSGPRGAARRRATLLNEVYPESEYNLQPTAASAGEIPDCCTVCTKNLQHKWRLWLCTGLI